MTKKGQAAMEFLMTYGWAILVVLVAIGALAYFGVLSPQKYLPSSCTVSNQFACSEFKASDANNNVQIVLQNGRGVDLTGVKVSLAGSGVTCTETAGQDIADGKSATFTVGCTAGIGSVGSNFKADVTVKYTEAGSTLGERSATGTLVAKVEA